jgi:muconolactone delta-isomerase
MKLLAIETELKKMDARTDHEILKKEALAVLDLQQKDVLREVYFDENHCAVLVLECLDKKEAGKILSELPLVKSGYIRFDIRELHPYTGFSRLMVDMDHPNTSG